MGCGTSSDRTNGPYSRPLVECPIPAEELAERGWHKKVVEEGHGDKVKKNARIVLDFQGYLMDPPYTCFAEGEKEIEKAGKGLVRGVNKAVIEMREGETSIISCSSKYGYGTKIMPGIPSESSLIFKLTVKSIVPMKKPVTPKSVD
ncbi:hypothetical protein DIPPA_19816 [Diplonema papillatum]|nr:hypothetical protein DIPPA_19816 [Diplonema papillatum]KAJ9442341.1 hypothetical protein DIPPA_19816 [Diplonema papillatum]